MESLKKCSVFKFLLKFSIDFNVFWLKLSILSGLLITYKFKIKLKRLFWSRKKKIINFKLSIRKYLYSKKNNFICFLKRENGCLSLMRFFKNILIELINYKLGDVKNII